LSVIYPINKLLLIPIFVILPVTSTELFSKNDKRLAATSDIRNAISAAAVMAAALQGESGMLYGEKDKDGKMV
jgi:hypothetical protein